MTRKTSPLTILHLRQAAGAGGGADRVLADEIGLAAKSEDVRVVVVYHRNRDQELDGMADRFLSLGVRYHEIPGSRFLDLGQLDRVGEILEEEDVDLLHCHDPKSDVYGYLLGRRYPSVALFSTLHGWTKSRSRSRIYRWLDIWVLRRYDRVITVARPLAVEARAAGIRRVVCIENGVDTSYWQRPQAIASPRPDRGSPHVGFVGRLSQEKDPMTLIRTLALIGERLPAARFSIAGDGPERTRVEALARRFSIEDRLEMLRWLEPDELRNLYADLDVLLLTSRTEGTPMTILEAMAMEVPVVATAVGGVDNIVHQRQTGLTAQAGDADGLADAVCLLARDSEMARGLAVAGRRLVTESHSILDTWSRRLDCYRREIKARRHGIGKRPRRLRGTPSD